MGKEVRAGLIFLMLSIFSCGCGVFSYKNLGHRAGGDCFNSLPENSLSTLQASLAGRGRIPPLQERRDFVYLEFDVRETADHELVVFHDSSLYRMMQGGSPKLKIRNLTLQQLQAFRFKGSSVDNIPTLEEFILTCIDLKLSKPMVIEIKEIYSHEGKQKLLALCDLYHEYVRDFGMITYEKNFDFPKKPLILMSFPKNCAHTFGKGEVRRRWSEELKEHGIDGVYQPYYHSNLMK